MLLEILILKGLTAQRLYKSFGVKGLIFSNATCFDQADRHEVLIFNQTLR
jgi:hypothetical protein